MTPVTVLICTERRVSERPMLLMMLIRMREIVHTLSSRRRRLVVPILTRLRRLQYRDEDASWAVIVVLRDASFVQIDGWGTRLEKWGLRPKLSGSVVTPSSIDEMAMDEICEDSIVMNAETNKAKVKKRFTS